jgi:hypothetical protein
MQQACSACFTDGRGVLDAGARESAESTALDVTAARVCDQWRQYLRCALANRVCAGCAEAACAVMSCPRGFGMGGCASCDVSRVHDAACRLCMLPSH